MTTRQRMPWPTVTPKRKRRKLSPGSRKMLAIVFGILSLVLLVIGLLTESLLWYVVMAVSGLASLAQARAMQMEAARTQEKRANRARPTEQPGPKAKPATAPPPPAGAQSPGGPVMCTETRKPIDQCGCSSRHVATSEGAKRYGRPVGSPIGKRNTQKKPSATTRTAGA